MKKILQRFIQWLLGVKTVGRPEPLWRLQEQERDHKLIETIQRRLNKAEQELREHTHHTLPKS